MHFQIKHAFLPLFCMIFEMTCIFCKTFTYLFSINIQRGRDHGANSFTEVRKACMQQGRFRTLYQGAKMKKGWGNIVRLYGSVTEVDLYVGMLMEEPVPGSKVFIFFLFIFSFFACFYFFLFFNVNLNVKS